MERKDKDRGLGQEMIKKLEDRKKREWKRTMLQMIRNRMRMPIQMISDRKRMLFISQAIQWDLKKSLFQQMRVGENGNAHILVFLSLFRCQLANIKPSWETQSMLTASSGMATASIVL